MTRINSRQKGKRGELTVCKALGPDWRRTAQVRGKNDGAPDIECLDPQYAALWCEVKDRAGWFVGCKAWREAWATTQREAYAANKVPVMFWRAGRGVFVATTNIAVAGGSVLPFSTPDLKTALKLAA